MIYVGCNSGNDEFPRQTFTANDEPTRKSHGKRFAAVIGPFDTPLAADIMVRWGANNPHLQHVDDAERMAKDYLSKADEAIEQETDDAFDCAANHGQMFDNVKHMTAFQEMVAYWLAFDC